MIIMRATYEDVPCDEAQDIEHGWTTPIMPGALKCEDHDPVEDSRFFLEFASIWKAAMFIKNFHGAVWDYRDAEPEMNNGVATTYTLHVEDPDPFLFSLVEFIESRAQRHWAPHLITDRGTLLVEVLARDVTVGMELDLEKDEFADPDGADTAFRYEYSEVTYVEWTGMKNVHPLRPRTVIISGVHFCVAFPPDHALKRRLTDIEEKRWLNWRP